jgi:membrane protein implicated in regulation of membrane protease activity
MQMTPFYWLYFGVALILFEVMTPGLITLFFGLSALTVAVISWLMPGLAQGWQWLAFSVLSVAYIFLLRRSLKEIFSGRREVSDDPDAEYTGRLATVTEAVAPGRPGRVELGDTGWIAESDHALAAGAAVRIVHKKNLTLKVEAVV